MNTDLQLAIFHVLWKQHGQVSLETIIQETNKEAGEISAALNGMVNEGLVAREDGGYLPLQSASEYGAAEVRRLVDQFYDGDAVAFLADYIATVGPEERAALESAIDKAERGAQELETSGSH